MPCMPEIISKGTIFKKLDHVLSDHWKRVALIPDLMAVHVTPAGPDPVPTIPLTTIARRHGVGLTPREIDHINDDWFTRWWQDEQVKGPNGAGGVERVVRMGIIEAINKAEELNVPVDCWWECHFQHDHSNDHYKGEYNPCGPESVQVSVCWSRQQVTLNFHTPPPTGAYMDSNLMTIPDPAIVVKHVQVNRDWEALPVPVMHMPTQEGPPY